MENKNRSQTIIALMLMVAMTGISGGCTKVINLNLSTTSPTLVIEGNVYNQPGPYVVLLSLTNSYFDTNSPPPVTNGFITITDNNGTPDTLKQVSPGTYQTTRTQGVQGHTYTLKVVSGGKTYQATSTMPDTVSIAYLSFVARAAGGFGGGSSTPEFRVHCHFKDPSNSVKNYYRATLTYNDTLRDSASTLTVYSDALSMGDSIDLTLRGVYVVPGDTALVDLYSIDVNVYNYLNVLESILNANGITSTSTPQNPPSNISNGALGYFSASSVTNKSAITP